MRLKLIAVLLLLFLLVAFSEGKKKMPQKKIKTRARSENHHEYTIILVECAPGNVYVCPHSVLSLAGGFCSGMTVGLNSLSTLNLEIMQKSSDPSDKKMAQRILGVIHDHHLFLVTLLVGNAIVLESLPLVIHLIMPDWAAIIFSTVIVLIVAEVVPMSLSTGSRKYVIAYYGAPLVAIMIKLFWPVCYPIARGLDKLLESQHDERILRRDFLTFINDQKKNFLEQLQIEFINQVMNHKNKTVKEVMLPFEDSFMLQQETVITQQMILSISGKQYSFIPVYRKERSNVVGYVSSKEIIMNYLLHELSDRLTLKQLVDGKIVYKAVRIYSDAVAVEALEVIQSTRTKLLLVCGVGKHRKKSTDEDMSVISVYSVKQLMVKFDENIIGFITLNQILHELADYRATTLKTVHRKLSKDINKEQEEI